MIDFFWRFFIRFFGEERIFYGKKRGKFFIWVLMIFFILNFFVDRDGLGDYDNEVGLIIFK